MIFVISLVFNIFWFNLLANSEISLSAIATNPTSAEVIVTILDDIPTLGCLFQRKNDVGNIIDCKCINGPCNKNCQSDNLTDLIPGFKNILYLNVQISSNGWESYSITVETPFVNYDLKIIKIEKSKVSFEVVPITLSPYISESCILVIADIKSQQYQNAVCEGNCNPCTRFSIVSLVPGSEYELMAKPNFAKNPLYVDFQTYSYTYLLEALVVNENNATIRIISGDVPNKDTCSFLIAASSRDIYSWKPPRCNHEENCPDDCYSLLYITELKARESYSLLMKSEKSGEEFILNFTTGYVEYNAKIAQKEFSWVVIEVHKNDENSFNMDEFTFFIISIEFGTTKVTPDIKICNYNCISANITNLFPGIQYRLYIVPWKLGASIYVDFSTLDVLLSVLDSNIFPNKININFISNYEPRGNCSYRLRDERYNYFSFSCQPWDCPTDCTSVNMTALLPNKQYILEIHNTYSRIALLYTFHTKNVNYAFEQLLANVTEFKFLVVPDIDYTNDDFEDCSFLAQTSTGRIITLRQCMNPPCGYICSYKDFTVPSLESGQQYLIYMNSSFSDYEHHAPLYTVQSEIELEQGKTTLNTIDIKVLINETNSKIKCEIKLFDENDDLLNVICTEKCPTNCESFTLENLYKSQKYRLVISSNFKLSDTQIIIYTLLESPNITEYEITSSNSILVKWNYDFISKKKFIFTVFVTNKSNEALLFGHAYYPPTFSANLVFLPPETDMVIHVCASPESVETLTNCNTVTARITVTNPDPLGTIVISSISGKTANIALPEITPYQGNISECFIYSIYLLNMYFFHNLKIPSQSKIKFEGKYFFENGVSGILQSKFTADECRNTQSFQIGDEKKYNGIKNIKIRRDNLFSVLFRSCINSSICSDSSIPYPVYIKDSDIAAYVLIGASSVIYILFVFYVLYDHLIKKKKLKINVKNIPESISKESI